MDFDAIITLRRRLAKNRLAALSPKSRFSTLLLFVAGGVALVVAGHLAAPALMEPPIDLATPRGLTEDEIPAGAAALEASFWLTTLAASVLNFRVLELLFRRPDITALQRLPIAPAALFVDRVLAAAIEAVVTAAGLSLFFVPLIWHGGHDAAAASIAMLAGGLLFGSAISVAVSLWATRSLVPGEDGRKKSSLGDAYGGAGQLLLYAPAFALTGVVVVALFWKLLLGEPLRLGYFSEPFWIGSGIVVAITAGCLVAAYRIFTADYFQMAPRFHEADAAEFRAVADYQESSFRRVRRGDWGLGPTAKTTYRALVIDDDRRMAGKRAGYAVVLILAAVGLATIELDALPSWAVAVAPGVLIATVVNPWYRLAGHLERLDVPLGLPVSGADRDAAVARAALREFLMVGVPYAALAAVILGYFRGLGWEAALISGIALLSGPAVAGALSLGQSLGATTAALRWLPSVCIVALAICAVASLPATVVVAAVFSAAAVANDLMRRAGSSETPDRLDTETD